MSKQSALKQCEIFTHGRKTTTKDNPNPPQNKANTTSLATDTSPEEMAKIASMEEILAELWSMRGDFGGRLDAIDQRITGMTNTFTAFERKLSEARQEVADNTARIDQAETRIATTETAQEETATALKTAMKRIAQLETKTEDLENRARRKNLRIFGIREGIEGSRPLLEFVTEMIPTWLVLTLGTSRRPVPEDLRVRDGS
ncbi:hypothetical protein WMY93_026926 [Mugilogobius chulae]|uniref:Uncharacterized protein n=1 Tax=Mugilogobius chulae TaxID=88201 RepID=A0AAW0N1Q3_9GOBI